HDVGLRGLLLGSNEQELSVAAHGKADLAFDDVERPAVGRAALRDEHAFRAGFRDLDAHVDGAADEVGSLLALETPPRLELEAHLVLVERGGPRRAPGAERKDVRALGPRVPLRVELTHDLWLRGGEVLELASILLQVVELPGAILLRDELVAAIADRAVSLVLPE